MATTRRRSCSSRSRSTRASPRGGVFEIAELERGEGHFVLRVTGAGAARLFGDEAGGHRWQRVPPNERRGRVHTSTVTVAVLPEPDDVALALDVGDLRWKRSRGSGPGGQHRNKTESAIDLTHAPTGTVVHCESERSQHRNKELALARLHATLLDRLRRDRDRARAADRRAQVGSGMRGDKRRTIREQDDAVVDHVTGRTWRFRDYVRGAW